jgi:hypothetical protein
MTEFEEKIHMILAETRERLARRNLLLPREEAEEENT